MATRLAIKNYDGASTLRCFSQRGEELKPEPPIAPGQSAEVLLDSNGTHAVLEIGANAEMILPVQNPIHSLPRTLRVSTYKRDAKGKGWERSHNEFIRPRESINVVLKGPARIVLSEMPT